MLEFIVLGIVPGTHFNITYSWVLIIAAIFLVVLEIRYHKNYALKVQALTSTNDSVQVVRPSRKKQVGVQKSSAQATKSRKKPTTKSLAANKAKSKNTKKASKRPARRSA